MPFDVAMTRLIGNNGRFYKKITVAGLVPLLLVAGLPPPAAAAESCRDWNKKKFFKSATVDEVRACLNAGEDPNKPDTQGLTALHRAAGKTRDPAVIEALMDAGANPRAYSIAGKQPWHYARTNGKIKGSAAYQRLRMVIESEAKKADWSRVQALPYSAKTAVRLYNDEAPRESRRIKGRFDSATADSITLVLKDGQTRTVRKQAVRKVLTYRPFAKRWPGWVALAIGILLMEFGMNIDLPPTALQRLQGHATMTLPVAAAFFYGSQMKGIYKVPPRHRTRPQGDKQSADQDNVFGKQEELCRD